MRTIEQYRFETMCEENKIESDNDSYISNKVLSLDGTVHIEGVSQFGQHTLPVTGL